MEWDEQDLHRVLTELRLRRGDTTSVEVKRAAGGVPRMPETLCAFANMPNGGAAVLGVDEADGRFEAVGVHDVANLEAGLAAQARSAVTPSPHLEFQTFEVDGKTVEVVHVSPLRLTDKPAFTGGRAYLRQADGDYAMQPHELRMIEVAKLHVDEQVDYDIAPVQGHSQEDLDTNLVTSYVEAVRTHARRLRDMTDEQILRATNVLTASGEPTVAGLYALGHYPQGHFPALTVTAAVQLPGGEGSARNRNLEDFTGPLPVLLSDSLGWVEENLASINRYRPDGHMEVVPELPLNAVRELIANALVHRDLGPNTLGMGKQVQIRITPKSLFIQSPGGLKGVSLSQLESVEHAQAAVNQRLYQIAKRLTTPDGGSVIEGEGGGIREVFRSAQERGLHRPQLIDTGVQFKALLWRPLEGETDEGAPSEPHRVTLLPGEKNVDPLEVSAQAGASSTTAPLYLASSAPTVNEPVVLSALVRNPGPHTIHELAAATGLTLGQLRYALAKPLREGIVVMEGGQGLKSTRYSVKSPTNMGR